MGDVKRTHKLGDDTRQWGAGIKFKNPFSPKTTNITPSRYREIVLAVFIRNILSCSELRVAFIVAIVRMVQ
jgi:hypothetical protein